MIRGSSREILEEVGRIFGFWRNIRILRFFLLIWAKRTIDSAWLRNSRIALSECLVFYRHIPSGKKKSGWKFLFFHREKVFPKKSFQKFPGKKTKFWTNRQFQILSGKKFIEKKIGNVIEIFFQNSGKIKNFFLDDKILFCCFCFCFALKTP